MFTLILYAFLSSGPDVQEVRTVKEQAGTYATMALCQQAKRTAIMEAKRGKLKQVGGYCQPNVRERQYANIRP